MKKLKRLTKIFLKDMRSWHDTPTPEDINGGDCYNWAWIAKKLIPNAQLLFTEYFGGHAWIMLDGKHYDAEAPNGVKHWVDLPCFRNKKIKLDKNLLSKEKFKKYWDLNTKQNKRVLKHFNA